MAKGNKSRINKQQNGIAEVNLDYEKLAETIAKAEVKAQELIAQQDVDNKTRENEEWRKLFGYVEGKPFTNIKAFIKLLFVKKADIRGDRATFALLQISAESILKIAKNTLYLFTLICASAPVYIAVTKQTIHIGAIVLDLLMGIIAFVYARLLRIAEIEIENLTDREYLNTIIASITALVAMVLSLISLFRG